MVVIETFVFFDLETTGLPWEERNQTKIIELCMIAASRTDILRAQIHTPPDFKVLSFLLNPAPKEVNPEVVRMTGISPQDLQGARTFLDQYKNVMKFLSSLPKPVCLLAHNGNNFDYKIFRAEVRDAKKRLPKDIYCADTLLAFRQLDRASLLNKSVNLPSLSTDEWPDLDISMQEFASIDELCEILSDSLTNPDSTCNPRDEVAGVVKTNIMPKTFLKNSSPKPVASKPQKPYSLSTLKDSLARLLYKPTELRLTAECFCNVWLPLGMCFCCGLIKIASSLVRLDLFRGTRKFNALPIGNLTRFLSHSVHIAKFYSIIQGIFL